jgi:hypothetical protein
MYWLDIKDAPREDGVLVDLYSPTRGRLVNCTYDMESKLWRRVRDWGEASDGVWVMDPTHYMPLPGRPLPADIKKRLLSWYAREEDAQMWWATPQKLLDNRRPCFASNNDVVRLLDQMDQGVHL